MHHDLGLGLQPQRHDTQPLDPHLRRRRGLPRRARTDLLRRDVNTVHGITGVHGFAWDVPARWRDGRVHGVRVHAINLGPGRNGALYDGTIGPCA